MSSLKGKLRLPALSFFRHAYLLNPLVWNRNQTKTRICEIDLDRDRPHEPPQYKKAYDSQGDFVAYIFLFKQNKLFRILYVLFNNLIE